MNILIICTWFPPDTTIGAVRPFAFAKYLSEYGNNVTVLRAEAFYRQVDENFQNCEKVKFSVFPSTDNNDIVEHLRKAQRSKATGKRRFSYLPENLRNSLSTVYREITFPLDLLKAMNRYKMQKKNLEKIDAKFDIVFSTYGDLENIFLGRYAVKKFHCKLIQDFRDPVVIPRLRSRIWNLCMRPIEKQAVQKADLCTTVAEATTQQMMHYGTGTRCITLYNGYERSRYGKNDVPGRKNQLVICYTGTIYPDRRTAAILLFQILKKLIDEGKLAIQNIRFVYAGNAGEVWKSLLKQMSLEEIYEDYGYLSRDETERLQREADIFLVLSWNTAENRGVISGKFYEGIRAEKPVLSVISGDLPNSELYQMNEKYHYGCCFEEARGKGDIEKLENFLLTEYRKKIEIGEICYHQNPQLEEDFCYENLAKKLETLCYELMGEKQAQKEEENER